MNSLRYANQNEPSIVDVIEPHLHMMLLGFFENIGDFIVSDVQRTRDEFDQEEMIFHFTTTVTKRNQNRLITLKVKLTPLTIQYPSTAFSEQYRTDFNLDQQSIDLALFGK